MKLKPIEPGCNAIVIAKGSVDNRGKHVVAELLIPSDGGFEHNGKSFSNHGAKRGVRMWKVVGANIQTRIDQKIITAGFSTIEERHLMRIDGDDFSDEDNPYAVKDKDRSHS